MIGPLIKGGIKCISFPPAARSGIVRRIALKSAALTGEGAVILVKHGPVFYMHGIEAGAILKDLVAVTGIIMSQVNIKVSCGVHFPGNPLPIGVVKVPCTKFGHGPYTGSFLIVPQTVPVIIRGKGETGYGRTVKSIPAPNP